MYLRGIYKKSAKVIVGWDTSPVKAKKQGGLTIDEGPNVRMGEDIKELIEAKKKGKPKHIRELLAGE